jgi:hypothetical protein
MSNRIRLALLLVLYCLIFWDASPDAIAPLIFAVPFFTIPAAKIGILHLAAWTGWLSLVIALVAFKERYPQRFTLAAKVGLSLSACLFIASSSPITIAAITAIPFVVVLVWPRRKQKSPNQTLQATAATPGS